ncbi:MAG: hypothetical protein ACTHQE_05805 [Thermomicrobiales bacterium]
MTRLHGEMASLDATTVGIDFRANTLTISAPIPVVEPFLPPDVEEASSATIDIGTRGRLLGIDLERDGLPLLAVAIAESTPADLAVMRTARVPITVTVASGTIAITFSRHGEDYDISWPSGNQCWRRSAPGPDGSPGVTCAVVTSD